MAQAGDVISYLQMCAEEDVQLRKGMNFRHRGKPSVILMSVRPGAPYKDEVRDDGRVLIYEGHDVPTTQNGRKRKEMDQQAKTPEGRLTENGLFYQAAQDFKDNRSPPEIVKVYEKVRTNVWVYNGLFKLIDAYTTNSEGRQVFKFHLELIGEGLVPDAQSPGLEQTRVIPTEVKREVWRRDKGRCVECGSTINLHFDHILPFSRGGTSLLESNIQILCAKHNLQKRDRIV